jgi:hypothetical protein
MSYVAGSTTVNGAPGPDPSGTTTLVWTGVDIAAGETITVSYDVQLTGVPPDEIICNAAYAETEEYEGLNTADDECVACITTPPPPPPPVVPAFNPIGLLLFAGLIPLTWVLIGRRKK